MPRGSHDRDLKHRTHKTERCPNLLNRTLRPHQGSAIQDIFVGVARKDTQSTTQRGSVSIFLILYQVLWAFAQSARKFQPSRRSPGNPKWETLKCGDEGDYARCMPATYVFQVVGALNSFAVHVAGSWSCGGSAALPGGPAHCLLFASQSYTVAARKLEHGKALSHVTTTSVLGFRIMRLVVVQPIQLTMLKRFIYMLE